MIDRIRPVVVGLVLVMAAWSAVSQLEAKGPTAEQIIAATQTGDEAARIKAIDKIAAHGEHAAVAVEPLTKLLADESPAIRAHALHALGAIGSPAKPAVEAISKLVKDEDGVVRRQAIQAILAIHPGRDVTLPLLINLLNDPDPGVKLRVLDAVTSAGSAAVPGLVAALKQDEAAYWACVIARQLGPVAKAAVPALQARLNDKDVEVRREAILALGAIGPDAAPALPDLATALDDEAVREAATMAMGQIDSLPPGADAKLVANAKGKDRFLSTLSYWTLARVHPNSSKLQTVAIERIAERLTDDEPFIRAAAAKALASLPPQPEITLPILEKILRDADEETISHVLGALATIGKPAVPQLIKALRHEKLRVPVISVLGMIGPDAADATEPLSQLLEDEDANVAIEAALTLAKIGPPAASAVPALSSALKRKDCCNAHAIVIALAKIGPPAAETSPQLEKLMQSDDPSLAALAAWTTTQVYPGSAEVAAKAIPVMEKGLAEPLPEARRAAAEALGTLGSLAKPAIPALQAAAKDADPSVQTAANQAIKQIQAGGQK